MAPLHAAGRRPPSESATGLRSGAGRSRPSGRVRQTLTILVLVALTTALGVALARLVSRLLPHPGRRAQFEWPEGLSEAEATARRRADRVGEMHPRPVRTWDRARRESILTVFNLNLVGLALVQFALAARLAAALTLLLLGFTTAVRLGQQRLATRRLRRFRDERAVGCSVIRDGGVQGVDPSLVVPGDVLVSGPGDQIVADGKLLGPGPVTVDTSALTGQRGWQRVEPGAELHAGTFCTTGRAVYRAERVGAERVMSLLRGGLGQPAERPTKLERAVAAILRLLLAVVLVYLGLLFAAYLRLDLGTYGQAIVDAAPVIFSLVPTGLYLMIVVAYAAGSAKLATHGALVRSPRSVEALAETTVVCFTEVGILAGTHLELHPLENPDGGRFAGSRARQILGDYARSTAYPTAVGRLFAESFDGERRIVLEEAPHLATLGWSAVAFGERDARGIYVVARPEALEGRLEMPLPEPAGGTDGAPRELLVLAHRPDYVPLTDTHGMPRLPDGLIPLAEVAFRREVAGDAMQVVRGFVDAGLDVKAFAVGGADIALGLLRAGGLNAQEEAEVRSWGVLSRADLERLEVAEWGQAAAKHGLFGGLTPLQVGALVHALRSRGEVVAVVGDGVADLPALAEANVAVAQPASTQAALGLADVVLLDNNPGALLTALRRGQSIVRGVLDVIKLNLTLVLCTALLIGYVRWMDLGFPYAARHGSLITIVTGTIPSVVMGVWAPPGTVSRVRYGPFLARFVVPAGVTLSIATTIVYRHVVDGTGRIGYAQLAVAYTLLYAGLLLNILIRRTVAIIALSAALAVAATLLPLSARARSLFRIDWLEPRDYGFVAVTLFVWIVVAALAVRLLTRPNAVRDARSGRARPSSFVPHARRPARPSRPPELARGADRHSSTSPAPRRGTR